MVTAEESEASPLYRLIEDEAQREILTATGIEGFFLRESRGEDGLVVMEGVSGWPGTSDPNLDDVELQVLDEHREVIGRYYIGRVHILQVGPVDTAKRADLRVSFYGYFSPFPHAGSIWPTWATGGPRTVGEWTKLPGAWHASWLHVVQQAWFTSGHSATLYDPKPGYTIDGATIANAASFYCALGESLNGPGGYFGSGPDALEDCLTLTPREARSFRLTWSDFGRSSRAIDETELQPIMDVFEKFDIDVSAQ